MPNNETPDNEIIDAHCHLDFKAFDHNRDEVIQRAKKNNISHIIIPGTQQKYWQRIKTLCTDSKYLHPCYGLHPYWVNEHKTNYIEQLDEFLETNQAIAVGECGLDFRREQADKSNQLSFFKAQLDIANNRQLPVVIHSVKATETVIKTLKKFKNLSGMIHSYSGSVEQAKQLIDLGFYISISGSVTYENAKKISTVTKEIPITSLIIETDAPDQADSSHHKERNEPSYLTNTLNTISKLREEPIETIAKQTKNNTKALFSL